MTTFTGSPTCGSRVMEEEELRQLNDRLSNYIQRVIKLENERSTMHRLLAEKEESKSREMENIRRHYEDELSDARRSLDEIGNETARLHIDYRNLSEEHQKLLSRNQKKESELSLAAANWKNLEGGLNAKESEFNNQLAKNRRLTSEVTELRDQLALLEALVLDTKNQLNAEMLRKKNMENQAQTLKQQLDFQKNISEQEVYKIRSKHESLVAMDSTRRREFENKLSEAMQELHQEHGVQIQQYKEELGRNFKCKLENAQQQASRTILTVNATNDELTATKVRTENLNSQLQVYQKEKASLECQIQELERTLKKKRELWQQKLDQKDQEMYTLQSLMDGHQQDYDNLWEVKLALDSEINEYRNILEGEEERIRHSPRNSPQNSPRNSPRNSPGNTPSPTRQSEKGRRKKRKKMK